MIFFWCILIATLFWFLQAMNASYITQITVDVEYYNIPQDRTFSKPPPDELLMSVNASGWDLFGYYIRRGAYTMQLNMEHLQNFPYIIPLRQRELLFASLPPDVRVIDITPDTIFFFMERLEQKTVPVFIVIDSVFSRQHGLSGPISVMPDSVTISGANTVLMGIDSILTERIPIENITGEVVLTIPLVRPPGVKLSTRDVSVHVPVERLTEGRVEIPVALMNFHEDYQIILVPERVTIIFQTALSNYPEIFPGMFDAVVDAEDIDSGQNRPLRVRLRTRPDYIYNVRIAPEHVDFIIIR